MFHAIISMPSAYQHRSYSDLCEIPGFWRGVKSSLFWVVTQYKLVAVCRRFATACRSHLQESNNRLVDTGRWDR